MLRSYDISSLQITYKKICLEKKSYYFLKDVCKSYKKSRNKDKKDKKDF